METTAGAPSVDGLFLGRFAHDPRNIALILEEATLLVSPANGLRRATAC